MRACFLCAWFVQLWGSHHGLDRGVLRGAFPAGAHIHRWLLEPGAGDGPGGLRVPVVRHHLLQVEPFVTVQRNAHIQCTVLHFVCYARVSWKLGLGLAWFELPRLSARGALVLPFSTKTF